MVDINGKECIYSMRGEEIPNNFCHTGALIIEAKNGRRYYSTQTWYTKAGEDVEISLSQPLNEPSLALVLRDGQTYVLEISSITSIFFGIEDTISAIIIRNALANSVESITKNNDSNMVDITSAISQISWALS